MPVPAEGTPGGTGWGRFPPETFPSRVSHGEGAGGNHPLETPETFGTREAFGDRSERGVRGWGWGGTGGCGSPRSPPRRPGLRVLGQKQRKGGEYFGLGSAIPRPSWGSPAPRKMPRRLVLGGSWVFPGSAGPGILGPRHFGGALPSDFKKAAAEEPRRERRGSYAGRPRGSAAADGARLGHGAPV